MAITVRAMQGDTLDLLCHRHLGTTAGVTEQALRLNPGLAELGPILPEGHPVTLPERAPATARDSLQLWSW